MIAFLGPSQGADSFWKRNQNLACLGAYVRLIDACYRVCAIDRRTLGWRHSGLPHHSEKCARDAAFLRPRNLWRHRRRVPKRYNFVLVIIWMPRVQNVVPRGPGVDAGVHSGHVGMPEGIADSARGGGTKVILNSFHISRHNALINVLC